MKAKVTKNEPASHIHSINDSQSGLFCKKCKHGQMLPAIEEGDPEYTDNFICSICHHQDTIPTKDLLFNQVLTGICGIGICIYLLSAQLSTLFRGFQHDTLESPFSTSGLALLAATFLSGFTYILFRAQEGLKHRMLYSKNTRPGND